MDQKVVVFFSTKVVVFSVKSCLVQEARVVVLFVELLHEAGDQLLSARRLRLGHLENGLEEDLLRSVLDQIHRLQVHVLDLVHGLEVVIGALDEQHALTGHDAL